MRRDLWHPRPSAASDTQPRTTARSLPVPGITGPLPRTRLAPAPLNLARGPARPSPLVCPKPRVKPDWEQTWLFLCFVFTLKPPWASLIAQLVKNPPAMWETWV